MVNNNIKKAGFTLLFASLIVSLILSIGLAIAHITFTQLVLSSAGRESQFAFYNADSGIECALYYEYNVLDSDSSLFFPVDGGETLDSITCNDIEAEDAEFIDYGATTTTTFSINPKGSSCVGANKTLPSYTVAVHKSIRTLTPNRTYNVVIESLGYNTCDDTNPRRVERGLYVKFVE